MTERNFDERLQKIEEEAARQREGTTAYRDQEIARLFNESGWTQDRIAKRMGKSQGWVSRRLVFGRFLEFMPPGHKDAAKQLTEKVFRKLYSKTKGGERDRFKAVLEKLSAGLPDPVKQHPGYGATLAEILADGKWYSVPQLHASMEEKFPDITQETVSVNVRNLKRRPPTGKAIESKKTGKTAQYRMCDVRSRHNDTIPVQLIHFCEKVEPLIDELDKWGRAREYEMSPVQIRKIAAQLRILVDELTVKPT